KYYRLPSLPWQRCTDKSNGLFRGQPPSSVDASVGASSSMTSGQRIAPYAWFIMLQAFVTSGVVFGIWFSFAVFFHAIVQELHWSRGGAAAAFSVGSMVQALLSPVCGM